jgi:2-polyprenyl-6-hydroxyphenyl methylase / 3-demethylubiquinone-9 3-methyltransferase
MTKGEPNRRPGVDAAEVSRFSALAERWWDPAGEFAALHKLNPVRLAYVRDHAARHFGRDSKSTRSLEGLTVLDVGCGGGLLCEPLARLGAEVTGVDPGDESISVARHHAARSDLDIDYRVATAEALAEGGERFDIVLAMEVIEHVPDVGRFLSTCAALVAPGGLFFAATINRTPKAFALAIVAAEYVLGWLPRGTHSWEKLVTPQEIEHPLAAAGMAVTDRTGVVYSPFLDEWRKSSDMDVNYMMVAEKPQE